VFVRAAEFWNAYLLSSFAIKKEEIEIEIERKARAFFFVDKVCCALLSLFVTASSPPVFFVFQRRSRRRHRKHFPLSRGNKHTKHKTHKRARETTRDDTTHARARR
jgi:hypothetical protein